MIGLPKSTEFNKRIPKQKFYENLTVTPALKTAFKEQIKVIYWRNKIAVTTMNLAPGTTVTELEVFEIKLNTGNLDEAVLRQIDKEIPYHILFLLEYEGKYQAWIRYKEASQSGNSAFKVTRSEKRKQLQKQIDALQAKIRKEKQLNKQMQMNVELKKLKKELEVL
ncbi:MAG: DUF4391 domain-containing protein [Lachnospiraceae bacterium]|nr:DUF4391 domain-containing protein [Lachnospiraceae bacterium]